MEKLRSKSTERLISTPKKRSLEKLKRLEQMSEHKRPERGNGFVDPIYPNRKAGENNYNFHSRVESFLSRSKNNSLAISMEPSERKSI